MRTARQTSVEAYHKALESGLIRNKRREIYSWLFKYGPATTNEIFRGIIGKSHINHPNIHARLNELRNMDCVHEVGTVTCPITNVKVIQWDVTDKLPKPLPKPERTVRVTEKQIHNILDSLDISSPHEEFVNNFLICIGFDRRRT